MSQEESDLSKKFGTLSLETAGGPNEIEIDSFININDPSKIPHLSVLSAGFESGSKL